MASKRKRTIVTLERPLLPTKERQAKPDFECCEDGVFRSASILMKLKKSGKISGEAESAAECWVKDYLFGFQDYCDPSGKEIEPEARGNIHTHNLNRVHAKERINFVRMIAGAEFHRKLVLILIENFSFKSLGSALYPNRRDGRISTEVSIICETLLNLLPDIYSAACLKQKEFRSRKDISTI
ncbi:hypothetical protein FAI40_01720 [Acetobacteraceae bacterium]|nr:hypothetical protein FAI40_01720 [Acetobacteraceae bacterium]